MAGMMPANRPLPMPPGAGAPPSGGDPDMGTDTTVGADEGVGQESTEPSEEEQDQYDELVNAAYRLIYAGGKVNDNILKLLDDDPKDLVAVLGEPVGEGFTPVIALAATATVIMLEVVSKSNPQPAGEVILKAGSEVIEDLAELAKKARIHTYTQEEINQAMLHATNLYRITGTQAGLVDEAALTAEFADILNAQERGDLGKILPGIERYDNGGDR